MTAAAPIASNTAIFEAGPDDLASLIPVIIPIDELPCLVLASSPPVLLESVSVEMSPEITDEAADDEEGQLPSMPCPLYKPPPPPPSQLPLLLPSSSLTSLPMSFSVIGGGDEGPFPGMVGVRTGW